MHGLVTIGHWSSSILGVILVSLYLCLYEDENKNLQDLLERWWVQVGDLKKLGLSKHTAFIRVIATKVDIGLDRLLGRRIISVRVLGISAAYSLASLGLFFWSMRLVSESNGLFSIGPLVASLSAFISGTIPLFVRNAKLVWLWSAPLILVGLLLLLLLDGKQRVYLVVAVLLCSTFLVATKRTFTWISRAGSFRMVIGMLLLTWMPLLISLALYCSMRTWHVWRLGNVLESLFPFAICAFVINLIPTIFSLVFLILALMVIVHAFLWEYVQRLIYFLQELGIDKRRTVCLKLGCLLLGVSGLGVLVRLAGILRT